MSALLNPAVLKSAFPIILLINNSRYIEKLKLGLSGVVLFLFNHKVKFNLTVTQIKLEL